MCYHLLRILIGFGCPVNLEDKKGYTPLFHAVKYGSLSVVIALVENRAEVNHVSKKNKNGEKKTPLFRARSYEIVKYLIVKNAAPILKDEKLNAVKFLMDCNPDAARAVLDAYLGLDQQCNLIMDFSLFDCTYEDDENRVVEEETIKLQAETKNEMCLLDMADKHSQTSSIKDDNENGIGEEDTTKLHGKTKTDKGTISQKEMCVLDLAEKHSQISSIEDVTLKKMIILHPLLLIYLNFKFKTIRFLFWTMLIVQGIVVVTLTCIGVVFLRFNACRPIAGNTSCFLWKALDENICHIYTNFNETDLICKDNMITTTNNEFALDTICKIYYGDDNITIQSCWTTHWLTIVTMFILVIVFLKESCEFLAKDVKVKYFLSLENILEMAILLLACSFLILSHYHVEWANHASAWMVFLAWIDFVLYIGRFSLMGKYIFMSLHVARVVLLCLLSYLPIFLAFHFGYYMLLQSNPSFNGYFRGFISVFAMAVDEINYGQFDYKKVEEEGGLNGSTQVMTVLFMIFMSLVLMNFLIAVTTNDIEVLRNQSKIVIANRKIDQLNEVIEYRNWRFFNDIYGCIIFFGRKKLPTLNMGNPVFNEETGEKNHFKMVIKLLKILQMN